MVKYNKHENSGECGMKRKKERELERGDEEGEWYTIRWKERKKSERRTNDQRATTCDSSEKKSPSVRSVNKNAKTKLRRTREGRG